MPDICDLILDDHEILRRRFAELDELKAQEADEAALERVWTPVADQLEVHASAEEDLFYPRLLDQGANAEEETEDAIGDHNDIRDGVRRSRQVPIGSEDWWEAVGDARVANSKHMAEEEREGLADFRIHESKELREELGGQWLTYMQEHAGGRGVDTSDKDVGGYMASH